MSKILLLQNRQKTQAKKAADTLANEKKLEQEWETVQSIKEVEQRAVDAKLAKKIGLELARQYKGHGWQVEADSANGIVKIFNIHMSGLHAYVWKTQHIHFSRIPLDVSRIGGELLERYGLSREKFVEDHVFDVKRDARGTAKLDLL